MTIDLIIIGAGAAGLAAAKHARQSGLQTVVLEAKNRIGGRAYTDTETFAMPVDHGCQWLHSADINPLTNLADQYGMVYWQGERHRALFTFAQPASPQQRTEYDAYCQHCWNTTEQTGAAGQDVAIADVVATDSPWYPLFSSWCAATNGFEPEQCSTLDFSSYIDTEQNWPLVDGYGALIARFGADVDVQLNTPVTAINWGDTGVKVQTVAGTVSAKAAVITVSNGVLSNAAIHFKPALPAWKIDALAAVPMGQANKVIFQLQPDVLDVPEHSYAWCDNGSSETMGYHLRPFGRELVVGYVSGCFSQAIENDGAAVMADFALHQLKQMYGSAIERAIIKSTVTAWNTDPATCGAYSLAKPGQAAQRQLLQETIADRLYFAGEATSIESYGTAHGAYQSGLIAVEGFLQSQQ